MADLFSGFDMSQIQGTMESPAKAAKAQSKAAKELAKMQGKIQKELAHIQAKYAEQQQAAAIQGQIQLQQGQQAYQGKFDEAEITGKWNGAATLEREMYQTQTQLAAQAQQIERDQLALQSEIEKGQLDLARLNEQNQNAIATGNLALAQQTQDQMNVLQTRQADLEDKRFGLEQQKQASAEAQFNKQFGVEESAVTGTYNGQETQQAKAQKAKLAMDQGALTGVYINPDTGEQMSTQEAKEFAATHGLDTTRVMGVDAEGNMTDAAQQWRTSAGLEYAKTAAQLAQNPQDYFESAAFMRGAQASGATGFLDAINQNGLGSNMGFRSAQANLPQMASMQSVAAGSNTVPIGQPNYVREGPSASVGQAQQAAGGQPVAYTESMNRPPTPQMPGMASDEKMREYAAAREGINRPGDVPPGGGMDAMYRQQMEMLQQQGGVPGAPQTGVGAYSAGMQMPTSVERGEEQAVAGMPPAGAPAPGMTEGINRPAQTAMPAPTSTGGGTGVYGTEAQNRLNAFAPTFKAGAHKLAPGALESMSATEKGLFSSAAKASGVNPQDFESAYKRSRLQTGVSAGAI